MARTLAHRIILLSGVLIVASMGSAELSAAPPDLAMPELEVDIVGNSDCTHPMPQKILQDTIWIADWTFDTAVPCDDAGWERVDNRILNDGLIHWEVTGTFDGMGGISGNAAALGYNDNLCCTQPNG